MRVPRSRSLFGSMLALAICHLSALPLCAQQTELQRVTFRVFVPQADAKLYVFDKLVSSTGEERELQTPLLDPTKTYFYEFKVFWEPNNYTKITRRKRVEFTVGKEVTVDLRQANPKQPDDIKIRYVPTPYPVVNEMLRLANVGKDDVVFDLGCGDGRIVVEAVRSFGAKRGVGVDIDPQRIKESRMTAAKAGVSDRVEFRQGDVLKEIDDLQEASVVMLYMGQHMNLRLKPILKKALKPGARVVSHRFTMGDDWKPEKTITVTDSSGEEYKLHLWTIK